MTDAVPRALETDADLDGRVRVRRLLVICGLWLVAAAIAEVLSKPFDLASPLRAPLGFFLYGYSFYAVAFTAAFFVYLSTAPTRRQVATIVAAGLALDGLRTILLWRNGVGGVTMRYNVGVGVGALCLAALGVRAYRERGTPGGRTALAALLTGLLLPAFVTTSYSFLDLTITLHRTTFDLHVYAIDGMLGFQPSFLMGRVFHEVLLLRMMADTVYLGLPVAFALAYFIDARAKKRPPVDVLVAFIVLGMAGFALYHVVPVVGPMLPFKKAWPDHPPEVSAILPLVRIVGNTAPRNCMPSLHTSWALLVWWQSAAHGRLVRALGHVFLALTLMATLGFGYHYATDLVVAFPFTLAVRALCVETLRFRARERLVPFVVGAALTAAWLLAIRGGAAVFLASSAFTWAAFVVTVGIPLALHRWMMKRAAAATQLLPRA